MGDIQHPKSLLTSHPSLCLSVVSVSELEFSAVDRRASPGLSTDCVTQLDHLEQRLNSTRSPLADEIQNWFHITRSTSVKQQMLLVNVA